LTSYRRQNVVETRPIENRRSSGAPLDSANLAPGAIRFRQSKAPGATSTKTPLPNRPYLRLKTRQNTWPSTGRGAFRFRQSPIYRRQAPRHFNKMWSKNAPSESTIPAFETKKNVVEKRAFQKIVHTCV